MPKYTPDSRLEESGDPLTLDRIRDVEESFRCTLPESYSRFLVDLNGVAFRYEAKGESFNASFLTFPIDSIPDDHIASVEDIDRESFEEMRADIGSVDMLYGADGLIENSKRDPAAHVFFSWAPSNIWPIGGNDMGDRICISSSGRDMGSVYYWGRPSVSLVERSEWPEMAFFRWVAKDFESFWNAVCLISDDHVESLVG